MNSAKTALCVCALVWSVCAANAEPPTMAHVAGVDIVLDEDGRPAPVSERKRQQILDNLRASFAQRGIPAHTTAEQASRSGHGQVSVGLDLSLISVARINADGALETRCVQGAVPAADFLAAAQDADE